MLGIGLGSLSIGITLGLLGSGGSIITVPVLAYLVGQEYKVAVAGSLVIVGLISLFASIPHIRQQRVDWRSVVYFGIPGMGGTYLGAWLAGFVSGDVQFMAFSIIMLFAAYKMLSTKQEMNPAVAANRSLIKIGLDGVIVGAVTGFVGVGGGFLIVPALVLLGGLAMHQAIATSLVIISLKSLSGFIKYQHVLAERELSLDWSVITIVTVVGILGSLMGKKLSQAVNQGALKQIFGLFLLIMAGYISWQSLPNLL